VLGQAPAGTTIENFRVSEKSADGNQTTQLRGAQAVFREDGQLALSDPRLISVNAEGKTNLVFQASECLYNQDTKEITSPGQLSLSTSDGQMQLSGVGFSGSLTGPLLTVSRGVKAHLNKKLRGVPLGQASTNPAEGVSADVIQISSTQFELQPGQAEFRESVTVTDVDGTLKSRVIKIGLHEEDWELQWIQAQGGVVVQNDGFKTTSDLAVYDLAAGTVLFRGKPHWEMDDRSGRADLLLVHQESKVVSAQGNVSMKLPADSGVESGLFQFSPTQQNSPEGKAESLEVKARYFVFQPASEMRPGYARYIGSVRLAREGNSLECQYLNIELGGKDGGGVKQATAIGAKLFQGSDQITSQFAVYDFENGMIQLNMNPTWNLNGQAGRADRLELLPDQGRFRANGNVSMKLPKQSGGIGFIFPEQDAEKNEGTGSPLLVDCETFEYRRAVAEGDPDSAEFQGNVRLANDTGFIVHAQSVALSIDPVENELNSLVATGRLNGATAGQNSMRFIGNRLVYDREADTVRLTGEPSVEIHTRQEGADVVALGQAAQYGVNTGQLKLTGNPVLRTPEGELRGNVVIYDQQAKRLRASGRWKMILNAKMIRQMQQSPDNANSPQP
tara:strand:+ start:2238 stop:4088 length:1851 start_codon:yes stop_codon:yes gene_type:complete